MARKTILAPAAERVAPALRASGSAQAQRDGALHSMAAQLGYEGDLSIGALEDGIRFYHRRSVEAILETGKRLLLLKEQTQHGEFTERVEALGIHVKTAQRFMQAAAKTSKSDKLSFLSAQVKSASAFLELATHDDDALERLAGTDEVERMSASELRATLREARAEKDATDQLLADKNKRIDQLKAAQKRIERMPADAALAELRKEATEIMHGVLGGVRGQLRQALIALRDHNNEEHVQFMAGLVGQVQAELIALRDEFNLPDTVGDGAPEYQRWHAAQEAGKR